MINGQKGWGGEKFFEDDLSADDIDPKENIDRLRQFVKNVRFSTQKRQNFENAFKTFYPNLFKTNDRSRPHIMGIIFYVKTRWNSAFAMIKRAVDLRLAIDTYITASQDEKLNLLKLYPPDWEILSRLCQLLKPLHVATLQLSKSKFLSLSATLPTYIALTKVFLI